MYEIVPFEIKHLELMDVRSHEQQFTSDKNLINKIIDASVAWTGIANNKIICCWGYIVGESGIANLWLIPSIYMKDMRLSFFRKVKEVIGRTSQNFSIMQTCCKNDILHARWMKFLGFKQIGILENFWAGNDYVLWGKNGA